MKELLKKFLPLRIRRILKLFWLELKAYHIWFLDGIVIILPHARLSSLIKKSILVARGAKIGHSPYIYPGVWIDVPSKIVLGDDVDLAKNVLITSSGGVNIGDRVLVGYGSKILTTNHIIPEDINIPIIYSGHEMKEVTIEDDVWICANVIITAGVKIGRGSVIAAGAVVTKDVEPYTIVGGVPARLIKRRITDKLTNEENS